MRKNMKKIGLLVVTFGVLLMASGLVSAATVDSIEPWIVQSGLNNQVFAIEITNGDEQAITSVSFRGLNGFYGVDCGEAPDDWVIDAELTTTQICVYNAVLGGIAAGATETFEVVADIPDEDGVYEVFQVGIKRGAASWFYFGAADVNDIVVDGTAPIIELDFDNSIWWEGTGFFDLGDLGEINIIDANLDDESCWVEIWSNDVRTWKDDWDCSDLEDYVVAHGWPNGDCRDEGRGSCKVIIGGEDLAENEAMPAEFNGINIDLTNLEDDDVTLGGEYGFYGDLPLFYPDSAVEITTDLTNAFLDEQDASDGVHSCGAILLTCPEPSKSGDECYYQSLNSNMGADCSSGTVWLPGHDKPESLPDGYYWIGVRLRNEMDDEDGDIYDFDDEDWAFQSILVESLAPHIENYVPFNVNTYYTQTAANTFVGAKICDDATGVDEASLNMQVSTDGGEVFNNIAFDLVETDDELCTIVYATEDLPDFGTYTVKIFAADNVEIEMPPYEWDFNVAEGYSIHDHNLLRLEDGWNLISIPVLLEDKDVEDVLRYTLEDESIYGDDTGVIKEIWTCDAGCETIDDWKRYINDDNTQNDQFTTFDENKAYWIRTEGDVALDINGRDFIGGPNENPGMFYPQYGWNLISYTGMQDDVVPASEYFGAAFDEISYVISYNGQLCNAKNGDDFDLMKGKGMWVFFDLGDSNGYWTVPNNPCWV